MDVADGYGDGVGGVVGLGNGIEAQEHLHQFLYLLLAGPAVAAHRLFDLEGGILVDGQASLCHGQEDHSSRLADGHGRTHVLVEEELLHGHGARLVTGDDLSQFPVEDLESLGQ